MSHPYPTRSDFDSPWKEALEYFMPYITSVERYGIEKGRQEGLQDAIEDVLAARFGKAGKRLMKKVRAISTVDELRALLKAAAAADNLQEIRDRLAAVQG